MKEMFDDEGSLLPEFSGEYSEGENPKVDYDIDWNKVKTLEDIKLILRCWNTFYVDYSKMNEPDLKIVNELFKKQIIK